VTKALRIFDIASKYELLIPNNGNSFTSTLGFAPTIAKIYIMFDGTFESIQKNYETFLLWAFNFTVKF
jgi:hypothetical protein